MPEYDQYLEEYVYGKIWLEVSSKDQDIWRSDLCPAAVCRVYFGEDNLRKAALTGHCNCRLTDFQVYCIAYDAASMYDK